MVPKAKEKALMTFDQVVARVKTLQGLEGCTVGDKWEGHTDNQLRVDVFVKKNVPGVTVLWEYHDGEHRHQCGKNSVKHADIDKIVADIGAAADVAVPGRYVQEVEVETAAARDPALLEAARVRGAEAGGITREAFEDAVRLTPEIAARLADQGRRIVPNGFVEPTGPTEPVEDETDPSLAEAARVQTEGEGPVEVDVEDGPPPEGAEQEQGDVDPDVEGQVDQG